MATTQATPTYKPRVVEIKLVALTDVDPDLSWLEQDYDDPSIPKSEQAEYRRQGAERLAEYDKSWDMVGLLAVAEVQFATPQGGYLNGPTVSSSGLWGVEDEWGEDNSYWLEVWGDQYDELRDMLTALCIPVEDLRTVPVRVVGRR